MRLLPAQKWKRVLLVVTNCAMLLIAPFEWRFICITLGFSHDSADRACEFVKFLLFDLNWLFGIVAGSGLIAAIVVGRDGLKGRSRRKAQFGLAAALTLFAINHLALIEAGNGDDLLLRIEGGVAGLFVGTPPEAPTLIAPYGRVFFEQPLRGVNVRFAPGITGDFYCNSRSFIYVKATFVAIWPIIAVTIGSTAGALIRMQRKRGPAFCPCGYDLTGNASGICPECGAAVSIQAGRQV